MNFSLFLMCLLPPSKNVQCTCTISTHPFWLNLSSPFSWNLFLKSPQLGEHPHPDSHRILCLFIVTTYYNKRSPPLAPLLDTVLLIRTVFVSSLTGLREKENSLACVIARFMGRSATAGSRCPNDAFRTWLVLTPGPIPLCSVLALFPSRLSPHGSKDGPQSLWLPFCLWATSAEETSLGPRVLVKSPGLPRSCSLPNPVTVA